MEETVLFHVVQPEDCDNTHETISSYNVFAVYSFTIYWYKHAVIVLSTIMHSRQKEVKQCTNFKLKLKWHKTEFIYDCRFVNIIASAIEQFLIWHQIMI